MKLLVKFVPRPYLYIGKALSPEEEAHWKKQAEKDFPAKPSYQWWEMPGREYERPRPEEPEESEEEKKENLNLRAAHHITSYEHQSHASLWGPRPDVDNNTGRAVHHWNEAKKLMAQGANPEPKHFYMVADHHRKIREGLEHRGGGRHGRSWIPRYSYHRDMSMLASRIGHSRGGLTEQGTRLGVLDTLPEHLQNVEARKAIPLFVKAIPHAEEEAEFKEAQRDISGKWPEWHERPEWAAEAHAMAHPEPELKEAEKHPDPKMRAAYHRVALNHHLEEHDQNYVSGQQAAMFGESARGATTRCMGVAHQHAERAAHHWNEAKKLLDAGHIPSSDHYYQLERMLANRQARIREAPRKPWTPLPSMASEGRREHGYLERQVWIRGNLDYYHHRMRTHAGRFQHRYGEGAEEFPEKEQLPRHVRALAKALRSSMSKHVPLYIRLPDNELRKAIAKSMTISKMIEGQQPLMQPIGPQDPLYAPHQATTTPKRDIHVEAAKHYIQADYHGRHPGGFQQAQHHHEQYLQLRKQGAQPNADHFKEAMSQLHPKFSQAMKSQPGLFVKAGPGPKSAVFPLESCEASNPDHLQQHMQHHYSRYKTAKDEGQKEYHRLQMQRNLKHISSISGADTKTVSGHLGISHLHDEIMKPEDTRLKRGHEDPRAFEKEERAINGITTPK